MVLSLFLRSLSTKVNICWKEKEVERKPPCKGFFSKSLVLSCFLILFIPSPIPLLSKKKIFPISHTVLKDDSLWKRVQPPSVPAFEPWVPFPRPPPQITTPQLLYLQQQVFLHLLCAHGFPYGNSLIDYEGSAPHFFHLLPVVALVMYCIYFSLIVLYCWCWNIQNAFYNASTLLFRSSCLEESAYALSSNMHNIR